GEHVVQQEERGRPPAVREQLSLREQEREDRQPLLALRAEAPQVASAGRDQDVVEVRPDPGDAAVEVTVEARLESGERPPPAAAAPGSPARRGMAGGGGSRFPLRAATGAGRSSAPGAVQASSAPRVEKPADTRRSAAFRCATAPP